MATSFAAGLDGYLSSLPKLNKWQSRLKAVIDGKPGWARSLFLRILESHARAQLGIGATEKIDWSQVDWAALLTAILKFLLMILPLFMGKPPVEGKKRRR